MVNMRYISIFLENNNQENPRVTILFVTSAAYFPPAPVNKIDQMLFYFLPGIYKHRKCIPILSANLFSTRDEHLYLRYLWEIPSEITQTKE
jgi:hypothetical protein